MVIQFSSSPNLHRSCLWSFNCHLKAICINISKLQYKKKHTNCVNNNDERTHVFKNLSFFAACVVSSCLLPQFVFHFYWKWNGRRRRVFTDVFTIKVNLLRCVQFPSERWPGKTGYPFRPGVGGENPPLPQVKSQLAHCGIVYYGLRLQVIGLLTPAVTFATP